MRCSAFLLFTILVVSLTGSGEGNALAGNLEPPADPASAASAMFSLDDIYSRLKSGTEGAKRTGPFTEPFSGPKDEGYTLNDIMSEAPSADNNKGAMPAEVLAGKTFWCLQNGLWGLRIGTMPTGTTSVSRTGQTIRFTDFDDGYYVNLGVGTAWPSPRFTNNGNGTITDNLTGLIWLEKPNYNSTGGATGDATWLNALSFCSSLADGFCGLTDRSKAGAWRLPNYRELLSLLDLGYDHSALPDTMGTGQWSNGDAFSDVQPSTYWTSTTYAGDQNAAWAIDLGSGKAQYDQKTVPYWIWPVR